MTDSTTNSGGLAFSPGIVSGTYQKAKNNSGILIFLIAILVYLSDIFLTRFDGLNVVYLYKTASGFSLILEILYKGILINAVFWLILIATYFIRKPQNAEEFISFLLLLATIFLVLSLTGLNKGVSISNLGALIHILFIIFAIRNGVLVDSIGKTQANYTTILLIFLDFFLFNLIYGFFSIDPTLVNRVLIPVLPIVTLVYMGESKFRSWAIFLIIFFYIILLFQTYNVSANLQKRLDPSQVEGAEKQALSAWDKLKGIFTGINTNINNSMNMVSGQDYYTGQVEQGQTEKLGVFMEDLKSADKEFMVNQSVEVWAKLKAYKLKNMEDTIKINVICYAVKGKKIINGTVSPRNTFEIDSYEEEFLTCKFPKNTLSNESGYYTVYFNATFNFDTQGYLKTYYMEKERKRVLISEEVDILSRYEIKKLIFS